jgi:hypothetical protein
MLWLLEMPSALCPLGLRAISGRLHEWCPSSSRCSTRSASCFGHAQLCTWRSRAPATVGGTESIPPPTSSLHHWRSRVLGVAVADVERLALGVDGRPASHRPRLASSWISLVLAMEKPSAKRTALGPSRRPCADPDHVRRKPTLGRTTHSRRIAQAPSCDQRGVSRQIHGPASTATVADVAHVHHQSQRATHGDGICEVLTAPGAPWQDDYVERVIGSIRRECLDHVLVFNEAGLRHVLHAYRHYERSRTHLALAKERRFRVRFKTTAS